VNARVWRLPASATRAEVIDRIARALSALPPNHPFDVTVAPHKPRRTDSQNAYLWGAVYRSILEQGGEQLRGWTADDLHEFLLGEHFGWEITEGFGRKRARPIRRSSGMNKQEFSDHVEWIKASMADRGIFVPEAGEREGQAA
jgi:hypothetical protein